MTCVLIPTRSIHSSRNRGVVTTYHTFIGWLDTTDLSNNSRYIETNETV